MRRAVRSLSKSEVELNNQTGNRATLSMLGRGTQHFLGHQIRLILLALPIPLRDDLIDLERAMCPTARVGEQHTVKMSL